jgi:hypothetical protein
MGCHGCHNSLREIAAVYLARRADGIAAFQSFARSYAAHPAGIEHDLIVIFKGYEDSRELAEAAAVFSPLRYTPLELPDEGFDLGSYLNAARRLAHEYVCCLNTYSVILADGWLEKLHAQARIPGVGIAGATGSYEGLRDTITLIQKGIWMSQQEGVGRRSRDRVRRYFQYFLGSSTSMAAGEGPDGEGAECEASPGRVESAYQRWWAAVLQDGRGSIADLVRFPPFPNPHIRTNAFMARRSRFLAFEKAPIVTKMDACHFESGVNGMTRQVLADRLDARIVGRNGIAYDVADWPDSGTFRLGRQENLLVADNQTALWETFNEEVRATFALMTWGTSRVFVPEDFPALGITFDADSVSAPAARH